MSVCRRVLLSNRQTVEERAHAPPDDEHRRTVPTPGVRACGNKPVGGLNLGGEVEHETIARLKCSIPKRYKTCVETHIS